MAKVHIFSTGETTSLQNRRTAPNNPMQAGSAHSVTAVAPKTDTLTRKDIQSVKYPRSMKEVKNVLAGKKILAAMAFLFFISLLPIASGGGERSCMEVARLFEGEKPLEWGQEVSGVITRFEPGDRKIVALTFDACGGGLKGNGYDGELVEFLRKEKIPATIFVNARWIRSNPDIFAELASDPLFEIANHGLEHKPLSVSGKKAYGISGTASPAEAAREIEGGAEAIEQASGKRPRFFRSGTNHYDEIAVRIAEELNHRVVGCSVNGDGGSTFSPKQVEKQILSARPGDIILMHMNRPEGGTAEGVTSAVPVLKERGFSFVRLSEVLK